jgi:hypothetical protein
VTGALTVVRGGWGLVLLVRPQIAGDSRGLRLAARVLGARQVAEAIVLTRASGQRPPRWPIVIDGLHCASMLAVAGVGRAKVRSDALRSATIAAAFAVGSAAERRSHG